MHVPQDQQDPPRAGGARVGLKLCLTEAPVAPTWVQIIFNVEGLRTKRQRQFQYLNENMQERLPPQAIG